MDSKSSKNRLYLRAVEPAVPALQTQWRIHFLLNHFQHPPVLSYKYYCHALYLMWWSLMRESTSASVEQSKKKKKKKSRNCIYTSHYLLLLQDLNFLSSTSSCGVLLLPFLFSRQTRRKTSWLKEKIATNMLFMFLLCSSWMFVWLLNSQWKESSISSMGNIFAINHSLEFRNAHSEF